MKAWTTNPPPKESIAKRPDRRRTTDFDRPRLDAEGGAVVVPVVSTSGDRVAATTAPAIAATTNTTKNRSSLGLPVETPRNSSGRPAVSAPSDPAAAATA